MNIHRNQVKKADHPSYEILHFRKHSFDNNIEILAHVNNHEERHFMENDFIYKRNLYLCGLNTRLNSLIVNIKNIHAFLYEIKHLIKMQSA